MNRICVFSALAFCAIGSCRKNSTAYVKSDSVASVVEFAVARDKLFLVGDNADRLLVECGYLKNYGRFLAERNEISVVNANCDAKPVNEILLNELQHPSYSYEKAKWWPSFSSGIKWQIDISEIVPRVLWSRYKLGKAYDGVCYNAAMVESGLLPFSAYSRFEPPSRFLLAFTQPRFQKQSNGTITMSVSRPEETQALFPYRHSWEIVDGKKDVVKQKMDAAIAQNFSPGSVLCIEAGPLSRWEERFKSIQNSLAQKGISIQLPPTDLVQETTGGHCLVFVTPSLIFEANIGLAHNLVSWDRAFSLYAGMLSDSGLSFHYFQTSPEAILAWRKTSQTLSNPKFRKLQSIAQSFHKFYEEIPIVSSDLKGEQIDLFRSSKLELPEIQTLQSYVKENFIPALETSEFSDFVKIHNEPEMNNAQFDPIYEFWENLYGARNFLENRSMNLKSDNDNISCLIFSEKCNPRRSFWNRMR